MLRWRGVYTGHLAVGLGLSARERRVAPLAILLGVGFLAVVNGLLVAGRIERVRPAPAGALGFDLVFIDWDHSIAMAAVWSVIFGGLVYLSTRRDPRAGVVGALAAFSHVVVDVLVHNGDIALWPGSSAHLGLFLWRDHPLLSYLLEAGLDIAAAAYFVARGRAAGDRGARLAWPVALLLLLHVQRWPAIDPLHWVARLPEPAADMGYAVLVVAGFAIPGALLAWLVARSRSGGRVAREEART